MNKPETDNQASQQETKPDTRDKEVVDLEEAGENFGVEDTPSNAPEEVESTERLRRNPGKSDTSGRSNRGQQQ